MFFITKKRHLKVVQDLKNDVQGWKNSSNSLRAAEIDLHKKIDTLQSEIKSLQDKLTEAESKIIKGMSERNFIILQARYERGKHIYDVSDGPVPADVIEIPVTEKDPAKTAKRIYAKEHGLNGIIGLKAERWELDKP